MQPIIFFGTEDFSAISLQALLDAGFPIAAIVTKPDTKKGRGKKLIPPAVKTIGKSHNIPVWQPLNLNEITADIIALQPVAGVLVSFGKIIPQAMIDLFTPGIINVHPSHLPQYRGPSPIESAILNGDTQTGVSIMKLSAKMDAGPVYTFAPHPLTGTETQPQLSIDLGERGAAELVRTLPDILNGVLTPTPQDEHAASYCRLIQKSDGLLDPSQTAMQMERKIRAYKDWPGCRATVLGVDAIITEAKRAPHMAPDTLTLPAADGQLEIIRLKPVGKNEMSAREFLNGYGNRAR